jgi:hypothetical protein
VRLPFSFFVIERMHLRLTKFANKQCPDVKPRYTRILDIPRKADDDQNT